MTEESKKLVEKVVEKRTFLSDKPDKENIKIEEHKGMDDNLIALIVSGFNDPAVEHELRRRNFITLRPVSNDKFIYGEVVYKLLEDESLSELKDEVRTNAGRICVIDKTEERDLELLSLVTDFYFSFLKIVNTHIGKKDLDSPVVREFYDSLDHVKYIKLSNPECFNIRDIEGYINILSELGYKAEMSENRSIRIQLDELFPEVTEKKLDKIGGSVTPENLKNAVKNISGAKDRESGKNVDENGRGEIE